MFYVLRGRRSSVVGRRLPAAFPAAVLSLEPFNLRGTLSHRSLNSALAQTTRRKAAQLTAFDTAPAVRGGCAHATPADNGGESHHESHSENNAC